MLPSSVASLRTFRRALSVVPLAIGLAACSVIRACLSVAVALLLAACNGGLPGEGTLPPPKESTLYIHTVTYACVPLRAELTIDGQTHVRGLFIQPNCPSPGVSLTDCYHPPAQHPQCPFSCPELTPWENDPPVGGTAPMHRFRSVVADDGTVSDPLTKVVHLKVSTLDDVLIWEGVQSASLPVMPDH